MSSLAEILSDLKHQELLTFGNLEDRVRAKNPQIEERFVAYEAKRLARMQILKLISGRISDADQYKYYKEFFKQQVEGEYVRLPINREHCVNLQRSPALQRLLKEKYIKMYRARGSMGYRLKGFGQCRGWKPYGVHQTYLVLNVEQDTHKESVTV
ncbi:hypothetical protein Octan_032 [Acinetobacter phage Octan]|uniref:Uncharacterized protein n=2 Tax=Lazarusvirus kimel TaxID=2843635 RepID=A0A7D3UWQ3_9CAUD|nr:hypothetical protein Octan_032 [Acinetobacter phage Octan]QNO11153.1 hypothetical protein Meroveus_032 [Acinetobacter phage Meroveus]